MRLWKSSSITYIAPKFGALALSRIDWPAMATVCLTPAFLAGDLLDLLHHVLRPLRRRGIGQLHVDQQIALVLRGNEARRRVDEAELGQGQQAAVDEQHEHADAQQHADHAACRRWWPRRSRR